MFFDKVGKMALGSRLRMLSEQITDDAQQIYELYNVNLKAKWFPVFYVLSQNDGSAITAIAEEIGHSHPSVSRIVSEMLTAGIVAEKKDKKDGRRNIVALTSKGRNIALHIEDQYTDVDHAIEVALARTRHNLWKALEEFEFLLKEKSLLRRVQEQKKERESKKVVIVPYRPEYKEPFRSLNEEWITRWFTMEEEDRKTLEHPEEHILSNGGHILVALYENEPVGVCALVRSSDPHYDFELAKMAVTPSAQGRGIGWLLGKAALDKSRALGAGRIYLESNTILEPAIRLYHKLGFRKIAGRPSPYERCNIQMELELTEVDKAKATY